MRGYYQVCCETRQVNYDREKTNMDAMYDAYAEGIDESI